MLLRDKSLNIWKEWLKEGYYSSDNGAGILFHFDNVTKKIILSFHTDVQITKWTLTSPILCFKKHSQIIILSLCELVTSNI